MGVQHTGKCKDRKRKEEGLERVSSSRIDKLCGSVAQLGEQETLNFLVLSVQVAPGPPNFACILAMASESH